MSGEAIAGSNANGGQDREDRAGQGLLAAGQAGPDRTQEQGVPGQVRSFLPDQLGIPAATGTVGWGVNVGHASDKFSTHERSEQKRSELQLQSSREKREEACAGRTGSVQLGGPGSNHSQHSPLLCSVGPNVDSHILPEQWRTRPLPEERWGTTVYSWQPWSAVSVSLNVAAAWISAAAHCSAVQCSKHAAPLCKRHDTRPMRGVPSGYTK